MAHAARVGELANGLVQSLLGISKDDPIISQTRNAVTRGLRDNSYGRTNQFEVKSRLDGLVEKFAVLNRDDLSDALQARLEELPNGGKWLPEILELFLSLSDRPVVKTAPDALASLYAAAHPDEQLTWADIIADDPLDETGIWDDVERGYHSSGDETGLGDADDGSDDTTSTQATNVSDDSAEAIARSQVSQPDTSALDLITHSRHAHDQESDGRLLQVSELALIRESLFMIRGLPTDLFEINTLTGDVRPRQNAVIATASRHIVSEILAQFSSLGRTLHQLRNWVRSEQSRQYVRTCQASTGELLKDFCGRLSTIEERFVGRAVDTVVSLVGVLSDVQCLARHLVDIAIIITHLPSDSPFALLNELYDRVCMAQLTEDGETFGVLGSMLFAATQTYLRPVATWISSGALTHNHDDFFVAESGFTCQPGDLWHSKYVLRASRDGAPSAPRFMQDSAAEMFALGKAKMFLDQLYQSPHGSERACDEISGPDFDSLRQQLEDSPLMPFSELFEETLQIWIRSISTDVTPKLKQTLLEDRGLLSLLTAIDTTYFSANGALFQDFADSLFGRIRRAPSDWSNSFLLTELARETLGDDQCIEPESLSIEVRQQPGKSTSTARSLETLHATYHISWPLQNITRELSPTTHARAFTFRLQVSHAYYILQSQTFDLRPLSSAGSNAALNRALRLRQCLLVFSNTLLAHISNVARTLMVEIWTALSMARDIDGMVAAYAAHKIRLETSLLLSANLKPLYEASVSCLAICEKFELAWNVTAVVDEEQSSHQDTGRSLQRMQNDFDSSLKFVTAGVRSVSRAGGETLLEALAERLELMAVR